MAAKTKPQPEAETGAAPAANGDKPCAVTREQFRTRAPATIMVTVNGVPIVAARMEFSTGGIGYFVNEKVTMEIDGVPVKLQCNCNISVVHGKNAK